MFSVWLQSSDITSGDLSGSVINSITTGGSQSTVFSSSSAGARPTYNATCVTTPLGQVLPCIQFRDLVNTQSIQRASGGPTSYTTSLTIIAAVRVDGSHSTTFPVLMQQGESSINS